MRRENKYFIVECYSTVRKRWYRMFPAYYLERNANLLWRELQEREPEIHYRVSLRRGH